MRWLTAMFAAVTLWMSVTPAANESRLASAPVTPNIVLILTDDQTLDELSYMPILKAELIDKGVTFTNAFVSNALCCPSRTTMLTGEYSHTTGVYQNEPPYGGYETFGDQDQSTVATWLDANDRYETALIGKYLNGYHTKDVPPGWDRWAGLFIGDEDKGYYNYDINIDGHIEHYGSAAEDYSTDMLAGLATQFINGVDANKPLFLYFAPHAPHDPATPPPRYADKLSDLPQYDPPNFNEQDVTDKPQWVQDLPLLTKYEIKRIQDFRNRQARSLMAVDDAIGKIIGALDTAGRLHNTLFVFTSDNGLEHGSHRWTRKRVAWEESIHMPMIVRYDPITQEIARTESHMVLNVDMAPTFADAAGVAAPAMEGTSWLPLLRGDASGWRTSFLLEHYASEVNDPSYVPTFCGVRMERYKYVRYQDSPGGTEYSEELYDLTTDPYELSSLAADPAYALLKRDLYRLMVRLCSPPPPGYVP
jgi:N-acetylglucosamine-6-sulfatase